MLRELIATIDDQLQTDESPGEIYADIAPQQAEGELKIVLISLPRVVLVTVITLVFSR